MTETKTMEKAKVKDDLNQIAKIPYVVNAEDIHNSRVCWNVTGLIDTNQLVINVCNKETGVTFEEVIDAAVLYPPMCDRIFGIDARDQHKCAVHSDMMWEKYKDQLLDD